jgi:hypothetical protein
VRWGSVIGVLCLGSGESIGTYQWRVVRNAGRGANASPPLRRRRCRRQRRRAMNRAPSGASRRYVLRTFSCSAGMPVNRLSAWRSSATAPRVSPWLRSTR